MSEIQLIGTSNCRDFSGIVNRKGQKITSHAYIRCDTLHHLTFLDQKALKEQWHLKTVIDLRTHAEILKSPDRMIPHVHYEHISIMEKSTLGISHEKSFLSLLENIPNMCDMYKRMVTEPYSLQQFQKVFSIICQQEGTILWHCTEGKDRCGLVSAFFLALLDVDKEEITKDYLLTNQHTSRNELKLLAPLKLVEPEKREEILSLFQAKPEYLEAAWTAIEENFGSMDAFLETQLGITPEIKTELQAKVFV